MQAWQVTSGIYHLQLLCGLLNRNSDLRVLLIRARINYLTLNGNLVLLGLSLLGDLSLELWSIALCDWLSAVYDLAWRNLTLISLTDTQVFRSEIMLANSWVIEQEVLVLGWLWSENLFTSEVLNLVRLVIYRFTQSGIHAWINSNWAIDWYEFGRFLDAVVHVVVSRQLLVVCIRILP
jgi:hypothetical protein